MGDHERQPKRRKDWQVQTGVEAKRDRGPLSSELYRALVECTDDAVLVADFDSGLFIDANPAACALFGYQREEWLRLKGRHLHPQDQAAFCAALSRQLHEDGRARSNNVTMLRRDGSGFAADLMQNVFEADGERFLVGIVRNVEERHQHELAMRHRDEMLEQVQKLASIGEVAAGIAHEVNNPAGYVALNLEHLDRGLERLDTYCRERGVGDALPIKISELRHTVEDSRGGMKRISAVAAELRRFSRVEPVLMQSVDLRDVVASALALTGTELRQRSRVVVSHHSGQVSVIGVPGKLTQVLTNLLVNAGQALDRPESDVVEITTARDGAEVVLTVTDTGGGMSADVCSRVFEPFFTTKSRDEGTGLGLSICADIMEQHEGSISVRSTPSVGTTFELRMPADLGCEVTPSVLPAVTPNKRVLVVDDEPNMLRAYRRLLSSYDVVSAPGGAEALELIASDGHFDFVICDLTMPGVDGGAVYRFVCEEAPHLRSRIAICTGGAVTASARELLETIDVPVVYKPVDIDELLDLIEGSGPTSSTS